MKILWMENLLSIEKIKELMENCDKDCHNCTKDEKNDCLLEMRESIHSLALHFKNAIFAFVEFLEKEKNDRERHNQDMDSNKSDMGFYT
ncbi:MAG: hypothetical protein ACTSWN_07115 [Promethearchaeota archaeon]